MKSGVSMMESSNPAFRTSGKARLVPLLYITILVVAGATAILYGIATSSLGFPSNIPAQNGQIFQTTGTSTNLQTGVHGLCGNQTGTHG